MRLISLLVFYFCLALPLLTGQKTLIDDFESGNLNNWTEVVGNSEIQGGREYSGALAVRLHRMDLPGGAQTTLLHNTFNDNWGIYEMACYVEGPVSDAQFIFQHVDDQNFYQVSCNPRGTDNPLLEVTKVVDGVVTVLQTIDAVIGLNLWFILKVERYCDGRIIISVDGDEKITVVDRSISQPGTIGLAAWAESIYFDEVTFESVNASEVTELQEFICSGQFYDIDTNRYSESGIYFDTLMTALGCDSIVRLELSIVPHYLVTERDTICAHEYYVFDVDTLRASGRYNKSLQSQYGCDSLVELTLTVLGGDALEPLITICPGEFITFNGDSISEAGIYYDTIMSPDGCLSFIQQEVEVNRADVDLGEDRIVCFEEQPKVVLSAEGFDSVQWQDGSDELSFTVDEPGTFWVQVFDNGCPARDTVVIAKFCEPKIEIYLPNAFSPNGDLINDVFIPQNVFNISQYQLRIFNRWGDQIFQSDQVSLGWNGKVDGRPETAGVYLYVLEVDGKKISGTVNLIR